uniref:Uncharacterized protein n=1 Tax=Trichobilharzia regenti TaxID=157069 RepID=A0AA85IYB3_TRIRE|nr:unnamed protein product [Trichobilharzia regenti]
MFVVTRVFRSILVISSRSEETCVHICEVLAAGVTLLHGADGTTSVSLVIVSVFTEEGSTSTGRTACETASVDVDATFISAIVCV